MTTTRSSTKETAGRAVVETVVWATGGVVVFGALARWVFPLTTSLSLAWGQGRALSAVGTVLVLIAVGLATGALVLSSRVHPALFWVAALLLVVAYGPLLTESMPSLPWVQGRWGSDIWLRGYGTLPFFTAGLFTVAGAYRTWARRPPTARPGGQDVRIGK